VIIYIVSNYLRIIENFQVNNSHIETSFFSNLFEFHPEIFFKMSVKPTSYRLVESTTLVKFTKNTFFISDDQKQFFYFLMLNADVSCLIFFSKKALRSGTLQSRIPSAVIQKSEF
jgi:hypothetical protein